MKSPSGRQCVYMAPEMLLQRPFTVTVDVYSIGIIIWEAVNRHPAFDNINWDEADEKFVDQFALEIEDESCRPGNICRVTQSAEEHKHQNCDTSDDLTAAAWQEIMKRCWTSSPASRPTAGDVLEAVNNVPAIGETMQESCR